MAADKAGGGQLDFSGVNMNERGLSGQQDLCWILSGVRLPGAPSWPVNLMQFNNCLLSASWRAGAEKRKGRRSASRSSQPSK